MIAGQTSLAPGPGASLGVQVVGRGLRVSGGEWLLMKGPACISGLLA